MNDSELTIDAIFAALVDVRTRAQEKAHALRQEAGWSDVTFDLDVGRSEETFVLGGYVDGERAGVGGVAWLWDMWRRQCGWVISRRVALNAGPEQEVVTALPDVPCDDSAVAAAQLSQLVQELFEVNGPGAA